jgi:hypothetical protein
MGSGTERDPLIVPGYSVTAAAVGTKTLVRRRFFSAPEQTAAALPFVRNVGIES